MNRSGIEWCDHTWNPVTGCRHGCAYCYAERMVKRFSGDVRLNMMARKDYVTVPAADGGKDLYVLDKPMLNETGKPLVYPFGFEPTFHRYRMDTLAKLKMGNNIFVGAMSDIFGAWVPDEWLDEIFAVCKGYPVHNFLFLTKNPERYTQYGVPAGMENMWYGTTVTNNEDEHRFNYLPAGCNIFVSIEPLHEDIAAKNNVMFRQVDWIIIGAETGNSKGKIIPNPEWVMNIVWEADAHNTPVFMKDSLIPIVGKENMRRDFPKQLQNTRISPRLRKKLYARCASCKSDLRKGDMVAILARAGRDETAKQLAYICRNCFTGFCEEFGIDDPDLPGLEADTVVEENNGRRTKK